MAVTPSSSAALRPTAIRPGPSKGRVLMPLPDVGFDVTEVAVPWKLLTDAGYEVVFANQEGAPARGHSKLIERNLFSPILGARKEAKAFYQQLHNAPSFQKPISWKTLDARTF